MNLDEIAYRAGKDGDPIWYPRILAMIAVIEAAKKVRYTINRIAIFDNVRDFDIALRNLEKLP